MYKKIIAFSLLLIILIISTITTAFFYSDQTQKFINNILNVKIFLSDKVQVYISKHISDNSLDINISNVTFLEPNWHNLIRVKIEDIDINSSLQAQSSNIKTIELGFSYSNVLKIIFLKNNEVILNEIDIKDITLNAKIDKKGFYPGPLLKILIGVNKSFLSIDSEKKHLKKLLEKDIFIDNVKLLLMDKRDSLDKRLISLNCNKVFISKPIKKNRTSSIPFL